MADPKHADTNARVEPVATALQAHERDVERDGVDNAAQELAAEHARSSAMGGDGTGAGSAGTGAGSAASAAPGPSTVSGALAALRSDDRPSPFGVSHFPPLPVPPGSRR